MKDDKQIIRQLVISIFFLILIALSIVALVYYFNENVKLKNENKVLLGESIILRDSLKSVSNLLVSEKTTTIKLLDSLLANVDHNENTSGNNSIDSNPKNGKKIYNEINKINNKSYHFAVHSLMANQNDVESIIKALKKEGYSFQYDQDYESRPSWLADKNTVFYYDKLSKETAGEMAKSLKDISGEIFQTKQGAGLGVAKGREQWTFFIHYIPKKLAQNSNQIDTISNKGEKIIISDWLKEGYYRQYGSIKLNLLDLDEKRGIAKIKITETQTNASLIEDNIRKGETRRIDISGNKIDFIFGDIIKAGKNPFKKAVSYKLIEH